MKIKMLRNCSAGGVSLAEGQVIDLPELTARKLIGLRRAVLDADQSAGLRATREEAPPRAETGAVKIDEVRKKRGSRR